MGLHKVNEKRWRTHHFQSGRRFSYNPTLDEFMGENTYDTPFVFLDSSLDISLDDTQCEKSGIVLEKDSESSADDFDVDLYHMTRSSVNQGESELTLKEISAEDENGERNTDGVILGHDASDFMSISSADSFLEFTEDLEILFSDDDERLHDEGKMVAELIGEEENSDLCQTLDGKIGTCVTDKDCSTFTDANSEECGVLSATNKLYCCVHSARCDQLSSELVTYMYNEGYPDVSQNEDGCPISINILPGICQVRIDILDLLFTPRNNESCDPSNAIQVISSPGGSIAKQILCGNTTSNDPLNTHNPHLYSHFNLSVDPSPLQSHFIGFFFAHKVPAAWNIRVTQIRCDLEQSSVVPLRSREKCSQWYTHSAGIIESGEILVEGSGELRSCIRPDSEACGVRYHVYNAVCAVPEQIRLLGFNASLCNGSSQDWEIVVPMTKDIGVLTMIDEQGANASFKIGYSFIYECADAFQGY